MPRSLGYILMLLGGAILVTGIAMSFGSLAGLYNETVANPLEGGNMDSDHVAAQMLKGVAVGAFGIPPFLVGFVLVRRANVRLRRNSSLRKNW
ncbi:MAG: hypothetical protein NTV94_04060 [Planctomycetota bacterium]|nr:hypothetical protein [Planctomycetota bacterium]